MKRLQLWFYGTMAIVMFIASCIGCVNIQYLTSTGDSLNYSRLGTQKITGLSITKDKDGLVKFKFDTQEGTEGKILGDLTETIKNFSSTLKVP